MEAPFPAVAGLAIDEYIYDDSDNDNDNDYNYRKQLLTSDTNRNIHKPINKQYIPQIPRQIHFFLERHYTGSAVWISTQWLTSYR